KREESLRRHLERYSNVSVVPAPLATDAKELAIALKAKLADPAVAPLSEAEAKEYTEKAIRYLSRMARGELSGYDIRPATDVVLSAAQSNRLSTEGQVAAFEAASRLRSARPQSILAGAVLDSSRPPTLRVAAAELLTRHIQKYGALLTRGQIQSLEDI